MKLSPLHEPHEIQGFAPTLRRDLRLALIVAALAALVRVVYLIPLWGTPFPHHLIMDAARYNQWALEIADGDWLGDAVFYQEPLYPYLLAVIHTLFGRGLAGVYVVQAMVGVVNCVLLQVLAARVVENRWAGLVAGCLLAFYGPMVFYEAQVLKVVWAVLLLVLLVHVLISAWERRRVGLWFAGGLLLALLGLTRGNALLYIPFVLVWVLLVGRRWAGVRLAAAVAALLVGLVLPLGLVCLRNYVVGGEVVLTSGHAGFNFYIGNNAEADGTYRPVNGVREDSLYEAADARSLASSRAGRELKPSEASGYWFGEAWKFIRDRPVGWLWLEMLKLARFLNAEEITDTWSPSFAARHVPTLHLAFVRYWMLVPAALVGLVVLFPRGERVHLLSWLVLATALSVVIFYVFGRYRMPVVPLFAVLAAGASVEFVRWVRAGEYFKPVVAILGAAAVGGLAIIHIPASTTAAQYRASEHFNLGLVWEGAGETEKAKVEHNRALTVWPDYANAMSALANIYLKEKKVGSARGLLHDAIRADESNAEAHYLLAGVYYRERKRLNAVVELEAAIRARPGFFEAYRDLGAILSQSGKYRKATRVLEAAARLQPGAESVWQNLGGCYYKLRDYGKARTCWRRALQLATSAERKRAIEQDLSRLPRVEKP